MNQKIKITIPFILMMVCIYFALIDTIFLFGRNPFFGLSLGCGFTTMIYWGNN